MAIIMMMEMSVASPVVMIKTSMMSTNVVDDCDGGGQIDIVRMQPGEGDI